MWHALKEASSKYSLSARRPLMTKTSVLEEETPRRTRTQATKVHENVIFPLVKMRSAAGDLRATRAWNDVHQQAQSMLCIPVPWLCLDGVSEFPCRRHASSTTSNVTDRQELMKLRRQLVLRACRLSYETRATPAIRPPCFDSDSQIRHAITKEMMQSIKIERFGGR